MNAAARFAAAVERSGTAGSPILTNWKAERERARAVEIERRLMTAGKRSFAAGRGTRIAFSFNGAGGNTAINLDIEGSLAVMRARSRDLFQNTAFGRRFIKLLQRNVIGPTGLTLQVRALREDGKTLDTVANSLIEAQWALWCNRKHCDIAGRLSFRDICNVAVASLARDGEFLIRRVRDRSLPFGYALQVLDTDRLEINRSNTGPNASGDIIRMSVKLNKYGRPIGYELTSAHPVDRGAASRFQIEQLGERDVFHDFITERPEQVRGFPWSHAVMKRIDMLAGYNDSALVAARAGASKMGFYTEAVDATAGGVSALADKDEDGNLTQDFEPGLIEKLPPGLDFKAFDPDYPHANYDPFINACARDIAVGLDVAHHNLTGNLSGVNYSSARVGEMSERDSWRDIQAFVIEHLAMPVVEDWLEMAYLKSRFRFPSGAALPASTFDKFLAACWFVPRGWKWVDPRNEADAAIAMINANLRSRHRTIAESGDDYDETIAELTQEKADLEAAGLYASPDGAAPVPPVADPNAKDTQA